MLPSAQAELLHRSLAATPWELALPRADGSQQSFAAEQLRTTAPEVVQDRLRAAAEQARSGFSYTYLAYPMIEAYKAGRDPDLPLHALTEFLNAPEFLDFVRSVVGEPRIARADAHATLYRPNDFLTLHDDTGVSRDRFAAYTFSLTPRWRPDWGGQLLFHDERGDVIKGLAPRFNTLSIFRVPRAHSVAPVAPYAGEPRLTVTGWLRAREGERAG